MDEKNAKPTKKLELQATIDASPEAVWKALTEGEEIANWFAPEASTEGTGVGGKVTFGWSEQMRWTSTVDAWEPGKRLRWFDSPSFMGEGTAFATEWLLEAAGGKTKLTLVQSAFGESEGWDDLFDGMEMGWTYFLHHLGVYLGKLAGKKRHMISSRFPVSGARDAAWQKLLSDEGGLVVGGKGTARAGEQLQLRLGEGAAVPGNIDLAVPGRILAIRVPSLDGLLFLEFEGCSEPFHIGAWLSVHDAGHAGRVKAGADEAFERAREAVA